MLILHFTGVKPKSSATIPKSVDRAMDKSLPSGNGVRPGVSIRNGPVEDMDIDSPEVPVTNGAVTGKRKSRGSAAKSYTEAGSGSDEDDEEPLVCISSSKPLLEFSTD